MGLSTETYYGRGGHAPQRRPTISELPGSKPGVRQVQPREEARLSLGGKESKAQEQQRPQKVSFPRNSGARMRPAGREQTTQGLGSGSQCHMSHLWSFKKKKPSWAIHISSGAVSLTLHRGRSGPPSKPPRNS